jgi:hypothetical protein
LGSSSIEAADCLVNLLNDVFSFLTVAFFISIQPGKINTRQHIHTIAKIPDSQLLLSRFFFIARYFLFFWSCINQCARVAILFKLSYSLLKSKHYAQLFVKENNYGTIVGRDLVFWQLQEAAGRISFVRRYL